MLLSSKDGLLSDCSGPKRNTVELHETVGDHCYWREVKGNGCKYYRNLVTNRYLGKDRNSSKQKHVYENVVFIKKETKNKVGWRLYFFKCGNIIYYDLNQQDFPSFPLAGFDSINNEVYSVLCPSVCEEWHLLVDQTDQSRQRAVVIKNKHSGSFLAVRGGRLVGAASYNEDCQWILV